MQKIIILGVSAFLAVAQPAYACLSCGCESSGSSSDLGTLGAASGIFSKGKKFLIQFGTSFRSINGSFNETGKWNPAPTESQLYSIQPSLGIMYFPAKELSFGLQLPFITNILNKATWGSFGSIAPTDLQAPVTGTSFGDMSLQATYKFYENTDIDFASAVWARGNLPTGQANSNPEFMSGSGVISLAGGIFGLKKAGNFEFLVNAGYQQPLGKSPFSSSSFSVGNAFLYQLQANYQLTPEIKTGLGLNGVVGKWLFNENNNSMPTSKIKLTASGQYDFSMYNGLGLTVGYDPLILGTNSMTDFTFGLAFYQYL